MSLEFEDRREIVKYRIEKNEKLISRIKSLIKL